MIDLDVHLAAITGGDTVAFGHWLAGSEPVVRESLRSFARVVDVEAVLQESLLRVWQVAPRFVADGKPNGLLRLALRIARNLAISETRRMRADPIEEGEDFADPAVAVPDPLLRDVIDGCRDRLPDQPRAALEARLLAEGGISDVDLATGLGMKLNTFLQNFGRARK